MEKRKMALNISNDDEDVAYLILPDHPGQGTSGVVAKQTSLRSLLEYVGPEIYLDFDEVGRLIGIEILA